MVIYQLKNADFSEFLSSTTLSNSPHPLKENVINSFFSTHLVIIISNL